MKNRGLGEKKSICFGVFAFQKMAEYKDRALIFYKELFDTQWMQNNLTSGKFVHLKWALRVYLVRSGSSVPFEEKISYVHRVRF